MGIKPTNSGQMIKMEQHALKSIKQKNNNNNDDDGSQRKAQSLLHTLLDEVNKDKAQIEELIKQKNLQAENAKADSLSEKRPSTRRSHKFFSWRFQWLLIAMPIIWTNPIQCIK
jgi:hypothetical protein